MSIINTLILLRFPFSFFLMPVYLFAVSLAPEINFSVAIQVFIILHLFIYPASNGYNSYYDKDTGSIGGLRNPPPADKQLLFASNILDAAGLIWAFSISILFGALLLTYVLASRSYSHAAIRVKKYPVWSLLLVVIFQGAVTFLMVIHSVAELNSSFILNNYKLPMLFSSLLLASMYPLTQVYQHEQDRLNGDITISMKLGIRGTFIFSGVMFICAQFAAFLLFGEMLRSKFLLLQLFLAPVTIYFIYWFVKVLRDKASADFGHTMRMNLLASLCLILAFTTFILLR